MHRVHKRSHDLAKLSKPGWRRFGFPLMYQTDVLEILGILTRLGVSDEPMDEALALVAAKQDAHGRWKLESTFNGRFFADIDVKGRRRTTGGAAVLQYSLSKASSATRQSA